MDLSVEKVMIGNVEGGKCSNTLSFTAIGYRASHPNAQAQLSLLAREFWREVPRGYFRRVDKSLQAKRAASSERECIL